MIDHGRWLLLASAGMSYTGEGDILPSQQKHWIPLGAVTLGYHLMDRFTLQGQVYAHGAPYRGSVMSPLVHTGVPVTVSAHYRLSAKHVLSFGFQEKLNYGASPDFGIFIGLDLASAPSADRIDGS